MIFRILFVCIVLNAFFTVAGCKTDSSEQAVETPLDDSEVSDRSADTRNSGLTEADNADLADIGLNPAVPPGKALPAFPSSNIEELKSKVTYIDYVFYEHSFSMSMDNKLSIGYSLDAVASTTAKRKPACKPMGRIFFQENGKVVSAAEFYFSPGCTYLEFMEGKKPAYANEMSAAGKEFFNSQLKNLMPNFQRVE